jgi:hypothetical protein
MVYRALGSTVLVERRIGVRRKDDLDIPGTKTMQTYTAVSRKVLQRSQVT